jgi:hypothetical protein
MEYTVKAFNLDQVVERLGLKRRFLADWLRAHPWDDNGRPYYSRKAGKVKLFTEDDIRRIFEALPQPEGPQPERIPYRNHFPNIRRRGSSELTSDQALARLRELLKKKPRRGRQRSPKEVDRLEWNRRAQKEAKPGWRSRELARERAARARLPSDVSNSRDRE